ncbi:hypothetical protein [Jidongwangia harbinensis]|uniref:hypothetical protein n=1 Tax=Jidongwangia harbinensis TaxID=2878561 RepID=UPI001CD9728B|nr:hypothetical protein [Jidongwangia harbinensis]MCA2218066.1 hypothetical protein [Jidongwangia harbinensis]
MNQPDQQRPGPSGGSQVATGVVIVGLSVTVILLMLASVLGSILRSSGPEDEMETQIAEMLAEGPVPGEEMPDVPLGAELTVINPDPWQVGREEELIMRSGDGEVRVRIGQVTRGTGKCSDRPYLRVTLTARGAGAAGGEVKPAWFHLGTDDATVVPLLTACSSKPVPVGTGGTHTVELAFAATSASQLYVRPKSDVTEAVWFLT